MAAEPAYVLVGYIQEAGTATKTVIARSNRTPAVRLPKDVAFPDDVREVEIDKVGNSRVISQVGQTWESFFAGPHKLSDDFLDDRDQGEAEAREPM